MLTKALIFATGAVVFGDRWIKDVVVFEVKALELLTYLGWEGGVGIDRDILGIRWFMPGRCGWRADMFRTGVRSGGRGKMVSDLTKVIRRT